MEECVFCKILKGELPCTKLYEDEDFMLIKDINPRAKEHFIAVPKMHVPDIDMMTEEGGKLLGRIILKVSTMHETIGLKNGYRLLINQGEDAGQTHGHVVIHVMGGEKLKSI